MDNSWIERYMYKCEKKYDISVLAMKILNELEIKSDSEKLKPVAAIILSHFLHLESK